MQAGMTGLLKTFTKWQETGRDCVLATVTETEGSTYRKAGAQMLLAANGNYAGLLGGGCLEGDLLEHARRVLKTGQPATVHYDLMDPDEALWGLGLGCGGKISIFLQALTEDNDYQPFAFIAQCVTRRSPAVFAFVLASDVDSIPVGSGIGRTRDTDTVFGRPDDNGRRLLQTVTNERSDGSPHIHTGSHDCGTWSVFCSPVELPPELLILGGGPDAAPVVSFACELGWRVELADHRRAHASAALFPAAARVHEIEPDSVSATLDLDAFDAVIVMSHNLRVDLAYLRELSRSTIPYIGLLGSMSRRQKLLEDLGTDVQDLKERFHSPAGLAIAAETPEAIALSIIAEIHAVLHQAGHLRRRHSTLRSDER